VIDFIVTAVKEREPFVQYLQNHIPDLKVVWDKHKDPMETFMRAWGEYPDRASVRLQDDIILTKQFYYKVHDVIGQHPNDVIQFFSMRKADIETGSRWENGSNYLCNLCYYLPKGMSGDIFDYGSTWKGIVENPTADDLLMRDFLKENKAKYFLHVPSLVEHAQVVSAINPRRSKFRQSKTFANPELEKAPVVTNFDGPNL